MWQIKIFCFNEFFENTYILYDELKNALVFDPGFSNAIEEKEFFDFIETNQLKVIDIWNTHCHIDHIFGLEKLYQKTGINVKIHPAEQNFLDMSPLVAKTYHLKYVPYTGKADYITDNFVSTRNSDIVKVFHTPGHSPGSICFYFEKQKFVISGDVLFYESIGRTDLPFGNQDDLLNSIKTNLLTLPTDTIVYSGHGKKTSIGYEIENNHFLKFYL
ncbi:MAG: MBL fold metallo-hydrolase [Sediminibacterium sp.]|nr:MBL fold metallo-hydrolase [Sediminibacterium sp.]